uniref:SNF2 N-terminal domain-containing protein n=1 Tax=Amphimedon queenslandica TaxID=400682 RepID=A0A1X7SMQ1_AMPQE
ESVIFCRPTPLQVSVYHHLLSTPTVRSCLSHSHSLGGSPHLVCISALKKLCNCPSLVYTSNDTQSQLYEGIKRYYPEDYDPTECKMEYSGKLWVLAAML